MKFMLMMSGPISACETMMKLTQAEIGAHIRFMLELHEELKRSGELVLAEGLDFPPQAVIVKATRPDAPTISDGPFAETKEFLAGFWIVDVASRERALAIAAKASTAPGAGGKPMAIPIEVRQVMSAPKIDG
ncbi:MAG: hypothetical protein IT453_10685 [Planctomycetes bacterium]|nr:hypothetical protein [Planctomycetota bacterium]